MIPQIFWIRATQIIWAIDKIRIDGPYYLLMRLNEDQGNSNHFGPAIDKINIDGSLFLKISAKPFVDITIYVYLIYGTNHR